jgi:hypothetical protein
MMRYRALLVLAIIAALLGAPSIASGAPKGLASPSVTPASGTVATIFTLTVRYESQVPATGVTVAVGGQVMTMTRIAGTAKSGTWAASGTLPRGTWAPVFAATAERGTVATVSGGPVSVLAPVVAPPTPDPTVAGSPESPRETNADGTPIDAQEPDAGGGDPPVAAPAVEDSEEGAAEDSPAAEPATPAPDGGPNTTPEALADGGTSATPGSGVGAAPGSVAPDGADEDEPATGPAAPSNGSSAPDDEPRAGRDDPSARGQDALADDEDRLGTVLLLGLAGVAGVTILGTGWLMAWRRRGGNAEEAGTRAAATEAVLTRRTLRRARVRLEEDPIVAAMGIDDQPARRARRSAREVSRGPGERPTDRS